MIVLTTQNLLILMCTTTYQNLSGIGVTPNESNGPESNGPSASVTLTKFVCGLNLMRTRWIRHFWIDIRACMVEYLWIDLICDRVVRKIFETVFVRQ
jgi:hypothetical protein